MAQLISLPNGAAVDADHVIEISHPYIVNDKYIVRVALDNGIFHLFDHTKIMDADTLRLRIIRQVNTARCKVKAKVYES